MRPASARPFASKPNATTPTESGPSAWAFFSSSSRRITHCPTLGGAKALRMEGEIGRISPGAFADLIGVEYREGSDETASLFEAEAVNFSMIGGNQAGADVSRTCLKT